MTSFENILTMNESIKEMVIVSAFNMNFLQEFKKRHKSISKQPKFYQLQSESRFDGFDTKRQFFAPSTFTI